MQSRSGHTTFVTPPPRLGDGDGDGDVEEMNASLWGELQRFIDLSLIYAKLPFGPFFRFRQVCKEWNRLASDRQFLEHNFKPPMSNLYFVEAHRAGHRLWTFQDSSWTSSRVPRGRCDESSLLYEDSNCNRVFDLHTRVVYSLPPLPSGSLSLDADAIVGMTVDTTQIPYRFRVFISEGLKISIYDSNSGAWTYESNSWNYDSNSGAWTIPTPSHIILGPRIGPTPTPSKFWNVHYNNVLYMVTEHVERAECPIHTYYLEKHQWGYEMFGLPHSMRWD